MKSVNVKCIKLMFNPILLHDCKTSVIMRNKKYILQIQPTETKVLRNKGVYTCRCQYRAKSKIN